MIDTRLTPHETHLRPVTSSRAVIGNGTGGVMVPVLTICRSREGSSIYPFVLERSAGTVAILRVAKRPLCR